MSIGGIVAILTSEICAIALGTQVSASIPIFSKRECGKIAFTKESKTTAPKSARIVSY
jgi:hypothetical protein